MVDEKIKRLVEGGFEEVALQILKGQGLSEIEAVEKILLAKKVHEFNIWEWSDCDSPFILDYNEVFGYMVRYDKVGIALKLIISNIEEYNTWRTVIIHIEDATTDNIIKSIAKVITEN